MTEWRWHNFTKEEMMCKCGCGQSKMNPLFMDVLQTIRTRYGRPMRISSAYRCPAHNSNVSSTGPDGPHTTGKAADILVYGQEAAEVLRLVAYVSEITGVGVAQKGPRESRFIHIDTIEDGTRPWVWSY